LDRTLNENRHLSKLSDNEGNFMDNDDQINPFYLRTAQTENPPESQKALKELENIYRAAHVGLCVLDKELRYVRINDRLAEINGIPAADHIGRTIRDVLPSFLADHTEGVARRVFVSGKPQLNVEVSGMMPSQAGEQRFWIQHWLPITDDSGAVIGINIVVHEITEQRVMERELKASQIDLIHAQEVGQIGSWRLDLRHNILALSDQGYLICGIPKRTQQTYDTFLEIVHPDDRSYVDWKWKTALRGEPYDIEHRIVVDGQVKWLRKKAFLENDDDGNPLGAFGIIQDITERKTMEAELRRSRDELELQVQQRTKELSEALRSLHEHAHKLRQTTAELMIAEQHERQKLAQILHDGLQQMLVAAIFRLELIKDGQYEPEDLTQSIQILDEAIETSRSLAAELSPPILLRKDLCATLRWLSTWMRDTHGLNVDLKYPENMQPLGEEILLVLFQSIRELLFNVVKHSEVREASLELNQQDGQILITIEDKGAGFDADKLHLKKAETEGLGLFSIRERLSLMGGKMEFDSAVGRGTQIRLTAPLSSATTVTDRMSII
jgi:PAS domain S-box-containing protein